MYRLGYNTNGLAHHRVEDALVLLGELGYRAVALTPDVGQLDPMRLDPTEVRRVRRRAEELDLALAVETGARFVLDPSAKHAPNLLDDSAAARARRVDFYRRCIDLAADLDARVVSLWAGAAPARDSAAKVLDADSGPVTCSETLRLLDRLVEGLARVARHAEAAGRTLAFEPEPGMFVERPAGYRIVRDQLAALGHRLPMTLDVGHCVTTGEGPIDSVIEECAFDLAHVHLDDSPRGRHEHRMFGEGELDLAAAMRGLARAGFEGIAAVELSRDSHRGPVAAREALAILQRARP